MNHTGAFDSGVEEGRHGGRGAVGEWGDGGTGCVRSESVWRRTCVGRTDREKDLPEREEKGE